MEVWWDSFTDGCDVPLYLPLHIPVGIMIMEVWWDGCTHGCAVPLYLPLHITVGIMIMEVWWDSFTDGCDVPLFLPLHITVRIMIMEVWWDGCTHGCDVPLYLPYCWWYKVTRFWTLSYKIGNYDSREIFRFQMVALLAYDSPWFLCLSGFPNVYTARSLTSSVFNLW